MYALTHKTKQTTKEVNLVRLAEDVDVFPRSDLQVKCSISKKKQPGENFVVSQLVNSPCFEDEPGPAGALVCPAGVRGVAPPRVPASPLPPSIPCLPNTPYPFIPSLPHPYHNPVLSGLGEPTRLPGMQGSWWLSPPPRGSVVAGGQHSSLARISGTGGALGGAPHRGALFDCRRGGGGAALPPACWCLHLPVGGGISLPLPLVASWFYGVKGGGGALP